MKQFFVNTGNRYANQSIHQIVPSLTCGDGIGNYVRAIRRHLLRQGADSLIYVLSADKKISNESVFFDPKKLHDSDTILYHYSIRSELTPHIIKHTGKKFLIYHNITPAVFFQEYQPDFAEELHQGRAELKDIASFIHHSWGVSRYNGEELKRSGFHEPQVVPIVIEPAKWNSSPDRELMAELQTGKKNILFTGRMAPHKRQDHLVEAFAWLQTMIPKTHLYLVGDYTGTDPYYRHVCNTIEKFYLQEHVTITGKVSDKELQAYFKNSHLYWSMSEHEGFGIPLIEAMWFDLPVFAYKCSAIAETLGSAAFMFADKSSMPGLAATAKRLVEDPALRQTIIQAQRIRRRDFLPEPVFQQLDRVLSCS